MQKKYKNKENKGFALLFSIVISSIILAITLGISNIAYKQSLLSISAKNANTALFAADTGIECALYLDKLGVFTDQVAASSIFQCGGVALVYPGSGLFITDTSSGSIDFIIHTIGINGKGCAKINVFKDLTDPVNPITLITSSGYNSYEDAETCTSDAIRTERKLEVNY